MYSTALSRTIQRVIRTGNIRTFLRSEPSISPEDIMMEAIRLNHVTLVALLLATYPSLTTSVDTTDKMMYLTDLSRNKHLKDIVLSQLDTSLRTRYKAPAATS